jgi:hypothetical protein
MTIYPGTGAKLAREMGVVPSTVYAMIEDGIIREETRKNNKGQEVKYLVLPEGLIESVQMQSRRRQAAKKANLAAKKEIAVYLKKKKRHGLAKRVAKLRSRTVDKAIKLVKQEDISGLLSLLKGKQ